LVNDKIKLSLITVLLSVFESLYLNTNGDEHWKIEKSLRGIKFVSLVGIIKLFSVSFIIKQPMMFVKINSDFC